MITNLNKYNFLKNELTVGQIVSSKILKRITSNKAVASIKGYHVVVKSDTPLIENSSPSFLISGFNEKDKIIMLKQLQENNYNSLINKITNPDSYIVEYLKQHQFPLNSSTIEIAGYLYLKDKEIKEDKLKFILKYLKYFSDIPLLYKLFSFGLNNQYMVSLLTLFQSIMKKTKTDPLKEKNNEKIIDDDKETTTKFILEGDKDNIINNLKFLFNNKNLLDDLIKLNTVGILPFYIYPLLINSDTEMGYLFNGAYNEKYYHSKLSINFNDEVLSFKLHFDFDKVKIYYNFYHFLKELKSLIIIDTNNSQLEQEISFSLPELKKKLQKLLKNKLEIYIKSDIMSNNQFKKNLDIYI